MIEYLTLVDEEDSHTGRIKIMLATSDAAIAK